MKYQVWSNGVKTEHRTLGGALKLARTLLRCGCEAIIQKDGERVSAEEIQDYEEVEYTKKRRT